MDAKTIKLVEKTGTQIIRCYKDPEYFISEFCKLKDQVEGAPMPFKLWESQKIQLKVWVENDHSITLKSRQIGISWLAAAFALWCLMFKRMFTAKVISKKEEAAIGFLDKVKFFYDNLPELFQQYFPLHNKPTNLTFILSDPKNGRKGSMMTAESSNPQAGRCDTLNLLIFDEAAFMPDANSIWTAAEPTLTRTKGKSITISTANGYGNFFQTKWEFAEKGINGLAYNFISWQGDPSRTQKWYDHRRKIAESEGLLREFKQEFPSNPHEAFIVSGNTFFSPELIESYMQTQRTPQIGNLSKIKDIHGESKHITFLQNSTGFLKIYEMPIPGENYCGGVDTAEGVTTGDYSVCALYNRSTGSQVAEYSGHVITDSFAKDLYILGQFYNFALLNIEMNSIGESLLNYLVKQRHYPNIYHQMRYDEHSNKKIKKLGWRTTKTSKRLILDSLNTQLINHEITPYSSILFHEMKKFMLEQTDTGNYQFNAASGHDDHIIAHALAAIILQTMPAKASTKHNVIEKSFRRKMRTSFKPKVIW